MADMKQPKKELKEAHSSALFYDKYVRYLFIASAFMVTVIILSIIIFVAKDGINTFTKISPKEFFFSTRWEPSTGKFGAAVFIIGSFTVTFLAIILGAPLGLAGAIFMAKIAPGWVRNIMRPATDLFVGIPSVVYGWIGLTIFIPWLNKLTGETGYGFLAAGIILGIMILPTVISISEDSMRSLPGSLEEASLALGATRWQTVWRVLVPAASPGILTAIILAMARAIGETMAVQMVIGNTPLFPKSFFKPTATLTSNVVQDMGNAPAGSTWYYSLFLMAFVLLVISLILILVIRKIAKGREV